MALWGIQTQGSQRGSKATSSSLEGRFNTQQVSNRHLFLQKTNKENPNYWAYLQAHCPFWIRINIHTENACSDWKIARNAAYKPLEKGIWGCLRFLHTVLIMEQHWQNPAPPPTPSQKTPEVTANKMLSNKINFAKAYKEHSFLSCQTSAPNLTPEILALKLEPKWLLFLSFFSSFPSMRCSSSTQKLHCCCFKLKTFKMDSGTGVCSDSHSNNMRIRN